MSWNGEPPHSKNGGSSQSQKVVQSISYFLNAFSSNFKMRFLQNQLSSNEKIIVTEIKK